MALRYAIKQRLFTGQVRCSHDPLNVGPLESGHKRAIFLREIYVAAGLPDCAEYVPNNAFAPWLEICTTLQKTKSARVLIWTGDNGAEYVFLRMACHMLATTGIPLSYLIVPPKNDDYEIGAYAPEELAPMIADARVLSTVETSLLAQEFDSIAARPELLRECDETGQLIFRQMDTHDDLLLAPLNNEWQHAACILGQATIHGDPRNRFDPVLLSARLRHLIERAKVEETYRGTTKKLENWYIRLGRQQVE